MTSVVLTAGVVVVERLNGLLTIGILAAVAMTTDTPSLFPSLGPTAFLLFSTPMLPSRWR